MIDKTCRRAGLLPRHIIAFVPVSRVTASQWLNGHRQPSRIARAMVEGLERDILAAVKARKLPFPPALTRGEELQYLSAVLKRATL